MKTPSLSRIRIHLAAIACVSTALVFVPQVQAQAGLGRVNVPFAFENGSQHLPAGRYTIGTTSEHILMLRGDAVSGISMMQVEETTEPNESGKVVFRRYGDRYVLREVWAAGRRTHLRTIQSKLEKELQLATTPQAPKGTEVALLEIR